jgi:hypothetical protein
MSLALWNIGFGLTFIVCGLSGELVLKGTDSSGAVAVLGVILLGWGILRIVSVLREDADESARSRRALYSNSRGTRSRPSWMPTRRRR